MKVANVSENYDFGNLSPIEFEALCVDLLNAETGLGFERFSPGADGGIDGRYSSATEKVILQAKHYKESTWSDLKTAAKGERGNISSLAPTKYYFHTSQPLTPKRKTELVECLDHAVVEETNIWGKAELNDKLRKHADVEKRHIKLWLSSAAVLERVLHNNIAVFTEATSYEIERILKVYVENPSLQAAAKILNKRHSLIISGPPGVGKTTLAQVLAAEYCDDGWELVAISEMQDALAAFKPGKNQVFVFDDFLGKIKLDPRSLARDEGRIARFIDSVERQSCKRFVLTTRSYVFQAAKEISDTLDEQRIDLTELVLDLSLYSREIKARILYNHLYHSDLNEAAIAQLISGGHVQKIIDHPNYMPRIIQWMTDHWRTSDVDATDYPEHFLQTLNRPHKIWEKAFRKHISDEAQLLLCCLYFAKRDFFPKPGVRSDKLKPFFENVIERSGLVVSPQRKRGMFEETLREIKSSFVIVEDNITNFVNPSVLDFLSEEAMSLEIVKLISLGLYEYEDAIRVWQKVRESYPAGTVELSRVAIDIQGAILSGKVGGRLPLEKMSDLVGSLLQTSDNADLVEFIRDGGLVEHFWTNESELVAIISELEEGNYRHFEHALPYARLLRRQLFDYVAKREFVLDIEEAATLAQNVGDGFVEFSDDFLDELRAALLEAVDSLDPYSTSVTEDPESRLGEWLEQIEKIEMYMPNCIDTRKTDEISDALHSFQSHLEMQMERAREDRSLTRSSGSASVAEAKEPSGMHPGGQGFSNEDLSAMFSSLKKP